jgi:ATP-binding cassette subfamily B protein
VLQDGDFFGEIALVDNIPRTATRARRSACLLLVLARQDFLDVVRASPALRALFERAAHARRRAPALDTRARQA